MRYMNHVCIEIRVKGILSAQVKAVTAFAKLLLSTSRKRVTFKDKGVVSSYVGPVAGYSKSRLGLLLPQCCFM
ncbi:hypothetical protein llap_1699 [Limosa lapponica baueri]|uniref:Uncharacterized protein n=1 Tax=Limosa lapponica baueri TaxID=1758121 RepID=A0A2I0UPL3_LIMLA|nr:hypothetical protein llap_1699 [Limosa lapponica baueri]